MSFRERQFPLRAHDCAVDIARDVYARLEGERWVTGGDGMLRHEDGREVIVPATHADANAWSWFGAWRCATVRSGIHAVVRAAWAFWIAAYPDARFDPDVRHEVLVRACREFARAIKGDDDGNARGAEWLVSAGRLAKELDVDPTSMALSER